jgi:hypothetical protein
VTKKRFRETPTGTCRGTSWTGPVCTVKLFLQKLSLIASAFSVGEVQAPVSVTSAGIRCSPPRPVAFRAHFHHSAGLVDVLKRSRRRSFSSVLQRFFLFMVIKRRIPSTTGRAPLGVRIMRCNSAPGPHRVTDRPQSLDEDHFACLKGGPPSGDASKIASHVVSSRHGKLVKHRNDVVETTPRRIYRASAVPTKHCASPSTDSVAGRWRCCLRGQRPHPGRDLT